jgi:hypothetical protein
MDRLRAIGTKLAKEIDEVARMLWEHGEMTADTEGGMMPTWDEICARVKQPPQDTDSRQQKEYRATCYLRWTDHNNRAALILSLDAPSSMRLAVLLLTRAEKVRDETEADLWRQIEALKLKPGAAL